MNFINKIFASKFWWLLLLVVLFAVNYLASVVHARFDLTKEKRYTLSKATKDLLKNLDDEVQIDVFLKGEFPAGFKKLATSTNEFLGLLKDRNGSKIHYRFISPQDEMPGSNVLYGDSLVGLGAVPINLTVQKQAGESSNIIFPVAVVHFKGKYAIVNLYPGASSRISQEEINSAESLMEYQFASAFAKLTANRKPGIAYSIGNGEPTDGRTYKLREALSEDYEFKTINLNDNGQIPASVNMILVVKPSIAFTEYEKLKMDQFLMQGGKLFFFVDNLIAEQDSLAFKPETIAYDRNLNLTDFFFRYGVRINTDLVMDLQCDLIPFVVGGTNENPQMELLHWNYYPLLTPTSNSVQGYIVGRFVNSIDTIGVKGVSRTPLLVSSPNSRIIKTPALISLNENKNVPEDAKFRQDAIPVAFLLEGRFTSLYRNKLSKSQRDSMNTAGVAFRDSSLPGKMIVVADGDMVFNDFMRESNEPGGAPVPIPMGWNKYTYAEYLGQTERAKLFIPVANSEFLKSCVETLISNTDMSSIKSKEIVLRLLDSQKVKDQKTTWQFINIGLPILLVLLLGWVYQQLRKRKYAA